MPSEVRRLKAVDARAALGHLVNVVVFSTKPGPNNPKPQQLLMGNGDLDGDTYWVCWDPDLALTIQSIDPEPRDDSDIRFEDANKADILQAICFVLCKDSLGRLCNTQLKLIDNLITREGLQAVNTSKHIAKIASLISMAVDFRKHGKTPSQDTLREILSEIDT